MPRDILIDVFEGNQVTDWGKLRAAGVRGVYARLGEALYLDPGWAGFYKGAKRAGLGRGSYYVCNPNYTVQQQVDFVKAHYDPSGELPFTADIELAFQYSNSFLIQFAHNILEGLEGVLGYKPLIYTGRWWWNPNMTPVQKWYANYRYWLASYPAGLGRKQIDWDELKAWLPGEGVWTAPVNGGTTPVMWQVSGDMYLLPGVTGKLDINLTDQLSELLLKPLAAPEPETPPASVEAQPRAASPYAATAQGTPVLNVPYLSQLGPGADLHSNDCGAACAAMLIGAYTGDTLTPDEVYDATGAQGDRYLSAAQLLAVLRSYNVPAAWDQDLPLGELFELLAGKKPFIALIKYQALRDAGLTESQFAGMHFLVVCGADIRNVYVHDPLWRGEGGRYLAVPTQVFMQAWSEAGSDPAAPNPTRGAVVPTAGLGLDVPTGKRYKVTATDGLNIRRLPTTKSQIVGGLSYGSLVYIDSENTGWGKLSGRNGWVNLEFVKSA